MNKMTVSKNRGTLHLKDSKQIKVISKVNRKQEELGIKIYNVVLQGVESAYSPNMGGPFKPTQPKVAESIIFYSLVARGQMSIKNGSDEGELSFSAELKDVLADVMFDFYTDNPKVQVMGWRVLDYFIHDLSPIEPERDTANAMLNGYLSQEVPAALEKYLRNILFDILKDEIESTTPDPCIIKKLEENEEDVASQNSPKNENESKEDNLGQQPPVSEGPDPGSAEYEHSGPTEVVNNDPAAGPDPGSPENSETGPPQNDPATGPDSESAEDSAAEPPQVIQNDAATGPDPGGAEGIQSDPNPSSSSNDGKVEFERPDDGSAAGVPDVVDNNLAVEPALENVDNNNSIQSSVGDSGAQPPDLSVAPLPGPDPGSAEDSAAKTRVRTFSIGDQGLADIVKVNSPLSSRRHHSDSSRAKAKHKLRKQKHTKRKLKKDAISRTRFVPFIKKKNKLQSDKKNLREKKDFKKHV